ncbi:uncharacterized protein [Parasteatoda tepidariorum]|uniref:uncharacterized protein n=1 Tax=Parasteatoda tepidariorum TaxID=114398 RepID=UPI00077FB49A|nr:adenine phosphoribosyltransferase [Parasteatoda tepidariorum]XP_042903882.1 adenine phosphoribosyltransferase [Parasteatoda tepidariorum]XP_042903883.1 adenine phosphoribosyltransferase [Parasteatoda tepidariorum]XP_042903884.1 adenine phosphoribosyltransferase [Parasteatoda tepidariorum]
MSSDSVLLELKNAVKDYPDFPKKGILFKDFLPIFQKPKLVNDMISAFQEYLQLNVPDVDCIAGIESRGFLIGPALSLKLQVPFIPIRKPGKLPGEVKKETYSLEYGTDAVEIQCETLKDKHKVVIVDDLLATGGTMAASVKLIKSLGVEVAACLVVIELSDLKGREKISETVHSLIQY